MVIKDAICDKVAVLKLFKKIFLPPLLGLLAGEAGLVFYLVILNVIEPIIDPSPQALLLAVLFASIMVVPPFLTFFMVHCLAVVLERILNQEWGLAWWGVGVMVGITSGVIHYLDLTASVPTGRLWPLLVMDCFVGGCLGLVAGTAQWWMYSKR